MKSKKQNIVLFSGILLALLILFFTAINVGSLKVSVSELFRGLFIEYNGTVATIYDLRFPRIFVALLAGGAIAVSGVLFQAVLKNPLADPALVGICSGANFTALIVVALAPKLFYSIPLLASVGGLITCGLIYSLSWKEGLNPLRIILVGVAIDAILSGILEAFGSMGGSSSSGVASIVSASITMKTWKDVKILAIYVGITMIVAFCIAGKCNLLALEDRTAKSIGVPIHWVRLYVSVIAVVLASTSTAIVGVISFLGLIVPHIARLLIGSDCRKLIPFSFLFGAFTLLLADTIGRVILAPMEVSASVIMAIIGGPFFIFLLRRKSVSNQ